MRTRTLLEFYADITKFGANHKMKEQKKQRCPQQRMKNQGHLSRKIKENQVVDGPPDFLVWVGEAGKGGISVAHAANGAPTDFPAFARPCSGYMEPFAENDNRLFSSVNDNHLSIL